MAPGPTTFFSFTAAQFAARLAATFPTGWCAPDALNPGGNVNKLLTAIGSQLMFENGAMIYALNNTRIQTSQDTALDASSVDYFGKFPNPLAIPRNSGESDAAYSQRLIASMLPTAATTQAVSNAVKAITGVAPTMTEGVSAYQGTVTTTLPTSPSFGHNPTPTYDEYTMNYDVAGSSFIDPSSVTALTGQTVINAVNRTKVFGTSITVTFV